MAKIKYIEKAFRDTTLAQIQTCNAIIANYQAQGFRLTLRQLYYQLVSRGVIPNKQTEYDCSASWTDVYILDHYSELTTA